MSFTPRSSRLLPLLVLLFALAGALASGRAVAAPARFGFDDVAALAARSAAAPYQPPASVPPALAALSYDQHRDIRFRPERALWRAEGLPFEVMFFHPGFVHATTVAISEITPDGVRPVAFDPKSYDYGANKLDTAGWSADPAMGHAGFRVHYPLNTAAYKDEVLVFLGASYFRAVGRGQHYGLSARGLAIDTVGGEREEFPRFTAFWLERPAANATALTIYALLDSPRATGAYRFVVRPGDETVIEVQARLFLRAPVARLGIAPLTSMFQHGENDPRAGDFRPEVHDSDGLSIATGSGEWLWRPLANPKGLSVSSFAVTNPRGFGMMQRDRSFASYEDVEARYDKRPSAWVEPVGAWGAGRVELMQFHTDDETNDNTVAYWTPEVLPAPGRPLDIAYRLHLQGERQQRPPTAWTVQSRRGAGYRQLADGELQFVVDFAGPALDALPADAPVEPIVTVGAGARLVERLAYPNVAARGWRMTLRVQRTDPTQPLELRAFLKNGPDALTETWTPLIQPD